MTTSPIQEIPTEQVKSPRIIQLRDVKDLALVEQATDGSFLTVNRVAELSALYAKSLEKLRLQMNKRLWNLLHQLYPETNEGTWEYDPYKFRVFELGEGTDKRSIDINDPREIGLVDQAVEGVYLTSERVGEMAAVYTQNLERLRLQQMNRVWDLLHRLFPETVDGNWQYDPYTRTMVELLDKGEPQE